MRDLERVVRELRRELIEVKQRVRVLELNERDRQDRERKVRGQDET